MRPFHCAPVSREDICIMSVDLLDQGQKTFRPTPDNFCTRPRQDVEPGPKGTGRRLLDKVYIQRDVRQQAFLAVFRGLLRSTKGTELSDQTWRIFGSASKATSASFSANLWNGTLIELLDHVQLYQSQKIGQVQRIFWHYLVKENPDNDQWTIVGPGSSQQNTPKRPLDWIRRITGQI